MRRHPSMPVSSALALLMCACAPSAIAPPATETTVAHRPQRIEEASVETGAHALSAPRRPDRVASAPEEPETVAMDTVEPPPVEPPSVQEIIPVPALGSGPVGDAAPSAPSPDLATLEVPPPPPAGTVVVPERVDLEPHVAATPRVEPPRRRRRMRSSTRGMSAPVFDSPSVFAPSDPSSSLPSVPAPPLVQ